MNDRPQDLADITSLGKQELKEAHTKTFDDRWVEKAEREHGRDETLAFRRRLQVAVQTARARELEDIVAGMRGNEAELRQAMADVEEAKRGVDDVAGYIRAATKVLDVFERALGLVASGGMI